MTGVVWEEKRGGWRPGAGRKKDPKVQMNRKVMSPLKPGRKKDPRVQMNRKVMSPLRPLSSTPPQKNLEHMHGDENEDRSST